MVCKSKYFVGKKRWRSDCKLFVKNGRVLCDDKTLPGLCKRLKLALWPHYLYLPNGNVSQTCANGERVEKQINLWFSKGKEPGLKEARIFCGMALCFGLRVVDSQAPVATQRVGTRIDYILEDARGVQYLVELKIGYNYGLRKSQGKLRRMSKYANNRGTHIRMQLAWMYEVVKQRGIEVEPIAVVITNRVKKLYDTKANVKDIAERMKQFDADHIYDLPGNMVFKLSLAYRHDARKLVRIIDTL